MHPEPDSQRPNRQPLAFMNTTDLLVQLHLRPLRHGHTTAATDTPIADPNNERPGGAKSDEHYNSKWGQIRRAHPAGFGYTHVLGYHPLLATIAGSGENLHGRLRKGSANTQRGAKRFVNELVARARRDDPTRELTVRFDSGFWNGDTIANLGRLGVRYTMAIRTNVEAVQRAIAGIDEEAWQPIDYTCDGEAQVAECDYTSGQGKKRVTRRLVVRRTRLTGKRRFASEGWVGVIG